MAAPERIAGFRPSWLGAFGGTSSFLYEIFNQFETLSNGNSRAQKGVVVRWHFFNNIKLIKGEPVVSARCLYQAAHMLVCFRARILISPPVICKAVSPTAFSEQPPRLSLIWLTNCQLPPTSPKPLHSTHSSYRHPNSRLAPSLKLRLKPVMSSRSHQLDLCLELLTTAQVAFR